ncbi:MAG: hypothetical protein KDB07_06465, partial [Planctomycetes bacterium]|nr:hypothetical protein [Planctomycetota bacterium]
MSEILRRNLEALQRVDPALAHALSDAPSLSAHIVECDDGGFTFRSEGEAGKWVSSRRAPKTEAERLLAQAPLRQ